MPTDFGMDTNGYQPDSLPGFEDLNLSKSTERRIRPEPERTGPVATSRGGSANRRMYTLPEAADLLGIGRSTAYDLAKRGELDVVQLGGRRLVSPTVLEALLGERPPQPSDLLRPSDQP